MQHLSDADLALIAKEAAHKMVGADGLKSVSVSMEPDSAGDPAYNFKFTLYPGHFGRSDVGQIHMGLHRILRDDLLARGDDVWPYIDVRLDESTSATA